MGLGSLIDKVECNTLIGIDASTQSLAFTIIQDGKPTVYDKIVLSGDSIYERIGSASEAAGSLLQHKPDFVAIESAVFVNNRQVVLKLAYVYGAIMSVFASEGIPIDVVPPITWMSYIGNPNFTKKEREEFKRLFPSVSKSKLKLEMRNARKQRTMEILRKRYPGWNSDDDDIADSTGIATYAWEELTCR